MNSRIVLPPPAAPTRTPAGAGGAAPADAARCNDSAALAPDYGPAPRRSRLRRWIYRRLLRGLTALYLVLLRVLGVIGRRPRPIRDDLGAEILLTGTFHSDNWITAHLRPLAASRRCARLYIVATYPVPATPNVVLIQPPAWLRRLTGAVPARLLTFTWEALRRRPHIVGGFHLLLNGLVAALVARLAGSRALYFCVGGPAEVIGGGFQAENRLFSRLEGPDPVIERRLIRAVAAFDLVITMGTRAVEFFRLHGVQTQMRVVSGGIDAEHFRPIWGQTPPSADLILVGRLVAIKRIDVFLRAVHQVRACHPDVRALIVGDGEARAALERLAAELKLDGCVTFAGQCRDVGACLRRARIFVLTSDSEGLALSLMEAMTSGLPAVVSDVGDLADLVEPGVNGYLVPRRAVGQFADAFSALLADPARLAQFSAAARASARRYELSAATRKWDEILASESVR